MKNKQEKTFTQKLLANGTSDTVSSKRLSMLVALIMLVGLAIASALGYNCNEAFIWVFASLVLGQSGLTTVEKMKKTAISFKEPVYSDSDDENENDDD